MRLQEGVIEQGGWWAWCKDTTLGSCDFLFYKLFADECPVDIWMGIHYARREQKKSILHNVDYRTNMLIEAKR